MNTRSGSRLAPTLGPSMLVHLEKPPCPSFWLDELRFADFDDAIALADDPAALRDALVAEYAGPVPQRALEALPVDEARVAPHALLVALFLRQKKSAAVTDVAEAVLAADELAAWRTAKGRLRRLPAALQTIS